MGTGPQELERAVILKTWMRVGKGGFKCSLRNERRSTVQSLKVFSEDAIVELRFL